MNGSQAAATKDPRVSVPSSSEDAILVSDSMNRTLFRVVLHFLPAAVIALLALFATLFVRHIAAPAPRMWQAFASLAIATFLMGVLVVLRRRALPANRVHLTTGVITVLALAYPFLEMVQDGSSKPNAALLIIILAAGGFLASSRALYAVLAAAAVVWAIAAVTVDSNPQWVDPAIEVLVASAISVLIFRLRLRTFVWFEEKRLLAARQSEALEHAARLNEMTRKELERSNALLEGIGKVQREYIAEADQERIFDNLLDCLLRVTGGERGIISELIHRPDGSRGLLPRAVRDAVGDQNLSLSETADLPGAWRFLEDVIAGGQPMITGDCPAVPRADNCANGRQETESAAGLPCYAGGRLVAVVGLANPPGGRDSGLFEFLEPILSTCGTVIEAYRNGQRRRRAEVALKRREERFRSLIENTSDIIAILGIDGSVRYVAPSVERLLGYRPSELVGNPATTIVHPDDIATVVNAFDADALKGRGNVKAVEVRLRQKDGCWCTLEAIGTTFCDERNGMAVIVNARDMTERKAAERLKEEVVSTVSHELRTPLTSLRGFVELLLKRDLDAERRQEFLSIIHEETKRLSRLIDDFLDVQRIDSGRMQYDFQAVSPASLIEESVGLFARNGEPHRWQVEIPDELSTVRADRDRIRQVLANLLSNATKFSPEDSEIRVGTRRDGEAVVFWVADQGIGIPAAAFSSLFQKFSRVHSGGGRDVGGTGLGLVLVKEIVRAHGGQVWVESEEGKGSTFFFTLLCADAPLALPDGDITGLATAEDCATVQ